MLDFSNTPVPSPFMYPKNIATDAKVALALGPEVLNVQQSEVLTKLWQVDVDELGNVQISSHEDSPVTLFTNPYIDNVDLTFDTIGGPIVTFEALGGVYIYWYDPVAAEYLQQFVQYGNTPSCFLDIKYPSPDAKVIVAYKYGSEVKYRLSSDRFVTEHDAGMVGVDTFDGAYMGTNNRIIFRATRFG